MRRNKHSKAIFGTNTATVIGAEAVFESATLKGGGSIRIDGRFLGTIDIKGHIVLGETGVLDGEVQADSALFAGKYKGDLRIKDTLCLASTADITGRIEAGKLIVDEGAIFNGVCNVAGTDGVRSAYAEEAFAAE